MPTSLTQPTGTLSGEKSQITADIECSFTNCGSLSLAKPNRRLNGIFRALSTYEVSKHRGTCIILLSTNKPTIHIHVFPTHIPIEIHPLKLNEKINSTLKLLPPHMYIHMQLVGHGSTFNTLLAP